MNRQQRRNVSKGKRAGGVAGVSLVAFAGLFGGYLGNGRTPRAYAAVACNDSGTYEVRSQADWLDTIACINASSVTVTNFDITIADDFTISGRSPVIRLDTSTRSTTFNVIGGGKTVTGDSGPNATGEARFLDLRGTLDDTVYVSDLTMTKMQSYAQGSSIGSAVYVSTAGSGQVDVYLDNITVSMGNERPAPGYLRGQVGVRGRLVLTNSTFSDNVVRATKRPNNNQSGAGASVLLWGPIDGSEIVNTTFVDNRVYATHEDAQAVGTAYGAALVTLGGNSSRTVVVENSTFTRNTVSFTDNLNRGDATGGAILSGTSLVVRDSLFEDNSASGGETARGGAIAMGQNWSSGYAKPDLTVENSQFAGNEVTALAGTAIGGAIGSGSTAGTVVGNVSISGSSFVGNSATSTSGNALGGAIGIQALDASYRFSLLNSTLTANSADDSGGAIYAKTAPLSVDFSTITGNAAADGGGIFSAVDDTITNSVVSLNTGTSGADVKSGGTTRSDHSLFTSAGAVAGTFTQGTGTVFDATQQVGALADNGGPALGSPGSIQALRTMMPLANSAILDTGSASVGTQPQFDQRGPDLLRVLGTAPDMGAIELGLPGPPTALAASPSDGGGSVAFTPSAPGSGPVTNYQYQLDGGAWTALSPAATGGPVNISGLANGQTYSIRLRAVSALGTGAPSLPVSLTPSSAPAPTPTPVFPPSAPRDVTAAPGDGSAAVSWREPADRGSFPVTDYLVTAGPGGKTCLAKAPALTCSITGLTNGTAYTFVVKALNGAGWGAGSDTSPAVTPHSRTLSLDQGQRIPEGDKERITTGGTATGIPAGAKLTPWIRYGDSGEFVQGEATITVGPDGHYDWSRLVLPGKDLTAYVSYGDLQSNRVTWRKATPRSLTLFQGTRAADGRHDRIRTGGTSVGLPEGARLTPWIRYGDKGPFTEGYATIVVDSRGNFTWTREIRKDKRFVAYVAYEDLESNRVVWQRVR